MRWPRFSLGALFLMIAVAGALFAYLRTLRRETLHPSHEFKVESGVLSQEEVTDVSDALVSILMRDGYVPSHEPLLPKFKLDGQRDWYRWRCGYSGEMYVAICYGPRPD